MLGDHPLLVAQGDVDGGHCPSSRPCSAYPITKLNHMQQMMKKKETRSSKHWSKLMGECRQ